jgi:hypothetical protein
MAWASQGTMPPGPKLKKVGVQLPQKPKSCPKIKKKGPWFEIQKVMWGVGV